MTKPTSAGYLLDTGVILRYLNATEGFSEAINSVFNDKNAKIYVSSASFFEIAVKKAQKKAKIPDNLPQIVEESGFEILPIQPDHAWKTLRLPHHHTDPYDRLLAAQAICANLTLITATPYFDAYGINILHA